MGSGIAQVAATAGFDVTVLEVEQKYAASGVQSGTRAQKPAEVLALTSSAVTTLLKQAGVTADTSYVQNLISAVVAILNVQSGASVVAESTTATA